MSNRTKTLVGDKARKAVLEGVNAIGIPVSMTLGPQARKALIYRTLNRGGRIVDDGHTVAQVQEPRDPFARLAAQIFREACQRTNEKVGDGTATTATIGWRLFNDCHNLLTEGASSMTKKTRAGKVGVSTLRDRILSSAKKVKEAITASATKINSTEELENIATVSVGDKELGKVIAKMAWETGIDGFIDVVEGFKGEIETEVIKGFRFPAKVGAKAFVNNPARYEMVMTDCPVLITNHALDNGGDIAQTLSKLNAETSKVTVIAPSFSDNVLVNMVNATKQGYFIYPIKVPALRTEQFEDLAIYCGAKFIDKNKGSSLRSVTKGDLGFFEKLIVKDTENREDAVVTGGRGSQDTQMSYKEDKEWKEKTSSPVKERIETLKGQLGLQQNESFKKLLERRIASMASAVGVIRVGDSTQASSLDRKLKIEDAVYACKAALRGGYVKGGGLCLKEIAASLPEDDILRAALMEPYERIQSSVDGGIEIGKDVIDPAEAELYAVEHACGVVANLITVEIITPEAEEQQMGDGNIAIAKEIGLIGLAMRKQQGVLLESELEMEKDRLHGLTEDEVVTLDRLDN